MISIVVTLAVIGLVLWLIETYIPMDAGIKRLIHIVAVVAVVLWLLQVFGVWSGGPSLPLRG